MSTWFPDGRLSEKFNQDPGPLLQIRPPGMKINFEFGLNRENWVIVFSSPDVKFNAINRTIECRYQDNSFELPLNVRLTADELPLLRRKFEEIHVVTQKKLPWESFNAALMTVDVFRFFLPCKNVAHTLQSPAEKLKKLIDEDIQFKYNISELSETAGYCRDYIRAQFQKEFRISPGDYRESRRLQTIMDLINNSVLNPGEIAHKVGLRHSSHLNALLRKEFNLTPSELIQKNRFRGLG